MKSTLEGAMKTTITILVLLCMTATLLPGETLPDAPSATLASRFVPIDQPAGLILMPPRDSNYKPHQSFAERHRKAILWSIVGGMLSTALIVGLKTRGKKCPSRMFYEGQWYPYDGSYDATHPCPIEPPGVDPSRR